MSLRKGPLAGLKVGISVSESDDLEAHGFTQSAVNRLTVRLSEALLSAGATLVFGHDWREDGIMDAICNSALWASGYPEPDSPPLIHNLLPWSESTQLHPEVINRLERVVKINSETPPAELAGEIKRAERDPDLKRYLRSRSLTHLRVQLTRACHARICLGGRESRFQGRYPGILEEAYFAFQARRPVYLVGFLGGAAERLGRLILNLSVLPGSTPAPPREGERTLQDLYREHESGRAFYGGPFDDRSFDPAGAWTAAQALGRKQIEDNGLSVQENRQLVETRSEEEAIILILRGLRRRYEKKEG